MKGLKCVPCPTGFQLHSWIIRRELGRRWRRRQCGGVDGKFVFFPSSFKVGSTQNYITATLYNSIYHIRQTDKQIDKKVGTLDVMKGLKCVPCPTGFQLHSWIIRRELRRRWRRRQCGGVDGKFAFFPSSSKVAGTRKAGDLSEWVGK